MIPEGYPFGSGSFAGGNDDQCAGRFDPTHEA